MKSFFAEEAGHGVGLLAAGNLMLSGFESFLAGLEPILHCALAVGQISVAAVTVVYIWRKAQAVKRSKETQV
jgi:hypothetical protein